MANELSLKKSAMAQLLLHEKESTKNESSTAKDDLLQKIQRIEKTISDKALSVQSAKNEYAQTKESMSKMDLSIGTKKRQLESIQKSIIKAEETLKSISHKVAKCEKTKSCERGLLIEKQSTLDAIILEITDKEKLLVSLRSQLKDVEEQVESHRKTILKGKQAHRSCGTFLKINTFVFFIIYDAF